MKNRKAKPVAKPVNKAWRLRTDRGIPVVTSVNALRNDWTDAAYTTFSYAAKEYYAFRFTLADGRSYSFRKKPPILTTRAGTILAVPDPCYNPYQRCGEGVNVATLKYCLTNMSRGYKLWLVRFSLRDIAAIPFHSDGKFRLLRCTVVREIPVRSFAVCGLFYRHYVKGPGKNP